MPNARHVALAGTAAAVTLLAGLSTVVNAKGGLVTAAEPAEVTFGDQSAPPELEIAKLLSFSTARLELPAGAPDHAQVPMLLDGEEVTLDLTRISVRSPGFRVLVDHGAGTLEEHPAPIARTYRGRIAEREGTAVAAAMTDSGMVGLIELEDGERYAIEPLAEFVDGGEPGMHVVYHSDDVVPENVVCGNELVNMLVPDLVMPDGGQQDGGQGGLAGSGVYLTEIAFDADFEYFQTNGSSVEDTVSDIENIFSFCDFIYDRDTDITYEITTIVVRASEADPYSSTDADGLLCQFRSTWNTSPESNIRRDVAQLYTGKQLVGSTIGLAWIGTVCNVNGIDCGQFGNLAYSIVESKYAGSSFSERISLSCHELGHNWSSLHCNAVDNCHIMCSGNGGCDGIFGANLKFGPTSVAQIVSYRSSVSCDPQLPDPLTPPFVDEFPSSVLNTTRWIHNNGASVSTGGTNEPSGTFSLNLDSLNSTTFADNEVRTNFIQFGDVDAVRLSLFTQHKGVEAGKSLFVEYFNDDDEWALVDEIVSDGVDQTEFVYHEYTLASDAAHNDFRLRLRVDGTSSGDDWYIDNILIEEATPGPINDDCGGALALTPGTTAFSTVGATISDPALPGSCDEGDGTSIVGDVWFAFTAPCSGSTVMTTCGAADFDTRLAVYDGTGGCPDGASAVVACNDDGNGCFGGTSFLEFESVEGVTYYVRVGGATGFGSGSLTVICTPEATCPGDLNDDGAVDGADLGVILGNWGGPGDGDLDENGTVDGADLGQLLGQWGDCP